MSKKAFNQEFAARLRQLMIARGFGSSSAASGVSPSALCKVLDCHTESALRYIDGRSVPTPDNIVKIAEWLSVTPGELLFGDKGYPQKDNNKLTLNKEILAYTLQKIIPVIKKNINEDEMLNFIMATLSDLSDMDIGNTKSKQVIDLMIRSTNVLSSTQAEEYRQSKAQRKAAS